MPNLTVNPRASRGPTDSGRPSSSLYREIGLAAVAIELKLELSTLGIVQPDVAEAIEQGAAALFDAGYGPSLIGRQRSIWVREKGSRQKVRRRASKARQSRLFPTGKGQIELRHETDGIRAEHIASLLNP
jgi:hypothetical protein